MLARVLSLAGRLPLLLLAGFLAIPLGYLLLRALGGFEAGRTLLRLRTLELIADTALLAVLVTVLSGVIGIALAWLVARARIRFARTWLLVLATPIVIPSYVSAFALIALFSPRGLFADPLTLLLGLERLPPVVGLPATVFAMTTICYPYVLLPTVAALHRTNFQLEEAARVLGKGQSETLRRILFPLVAPSAAAGALIVALYSIGDFGAVSLLDYDALSSAIYARYEYSLDRSAAAWFSLLLAGGALGLVLLESWIRNRRPVGWSAAATLRRPEPVPLGAWTLPAYLFMSLVVLASLAMPLSMLVYWTVQGFRDGLDVAELGRQAGGTVAVALAAGGLCALLAAPVSWLRLRRPGFLIRAVGSLAAVNYAIPGIALGLSLVLLASRWTPWIYQSIGLLVIAYCLYSLPLALGAARSNLAQVGGRLEEAARVLGRSLPTALWKVTLPLARPGLLAGAGLVFLTTAKELPITLLLRPTGFDTLAIEVWASVESGYLGEAGQAGLLLLILALPQVGLVLAGLRR